MRNATRVVLVDSEGGETEAELVTVTGHDTNYYVGFAEPNRQLVRALAYDREGRVVAEYRNDPREEGVFGGG